MDIRQHRGGLPWQFLASLLIAATMLAACNSAPHTSSSVVKTPPANVGSAYAPICPGGTACAKLGTAPAYHAGKSAVPSGAAVVGDWEVPDTVSPLFADQHIDFTLIRALYGACVVAGADLKWLPDECTEVPTQVNGDVSADGTIVKLKLLPTLQWSDGKPLTAADFVFGWQTLKNPKVAAVNIGGYTLITAVAALDPQTVQVTFKVPFGPYLTYLPYALPQHEFGSIAPEQLSSNAEVNFTPKATSGPYAVSSYALNRSLALKPNTHYVSASFYGPFLKSLTFRGYGTPGAMLADFSAGKVTLAQDFQPADLGAVRAANAGVKLSPAVGYEHVLYNQANKALANVAVRQALGLAIDRCAIAQKSLGGACSGTVAASITAPAALDFDKTLVATTPDLTKAATLLAGAGFTKKNAAGIRLGTDGKPLHFTLVTTNDSARVAEAALLVAAWKGIGVDVAVAAQPGQKVFTDFTGGGLLATGQFDIALLAFVGSADPDFTYDIYHSSAIPSKTNPAGTNYGHINDPKLDAALQTERGVVDFATRVTALHTVQQRIVAQQCYVTPLYVWPIITLAAPALHGMVVGATGDTLDWNIADWWLGA
ncbi:MAG: peptide ABC transporter substrate-binding protein [Ktedonobacterales bacterium]|nr:peptide ABC transporter substrate-binding protein [Ktedonobacterales bacterium]